MSVTNSDEPHDWVRDVFQGDTREAGDCPKCGLPGATIIRLRSRVPVALHCPTCGTFTVDSEEDLQ